MIGPFQLGKINIRSRNVLNGRIFRFAKLQRVARIGNHSACNGHDNASGIALDRNRMIQDEVTREQSKSGLPMFGSDFPH